MERTIYSNYDLDDMYEDAKQFLMEEYPELCDCEVTHKDGTVTMEPSEDEIWKEIYWEDEIHWEDTFSELKSFFKNKKVIFFGSIGRWDGTFGGGKIGNFEDLFYDAIEDCNYIEFTDNKGHLYLNCTHHDGSNSFEIKILSDKGYDFSEKKYDFSEAELHRRIATNNFLSKIPHYCREVWGCTKGC